MFALTSARLLERANGMPIIGSPSAGSDERVVTGSSEPDWRHGLLHRLHVQRDIGGSIVRAVIGKSFTRPGLRMISLPSQNFSLASSIDMPNC